MPLIVGHPPILGHPGLWPVLRNFSGAAAGAWAWGRILAEEGVVSCKKMCSCVRIRTSKRDFGSQRLRRSLRSSDEPKERLWAARTVAQCAQPTRQQ